MYFQLVVLGTGGGQDVQVHAVHNGFGHGLVHLWAEDGTLLATASQSAIVRNWTDREAPTAERPPAATDPSSEASP